MEQDGEAHIVDKNSNRIQGKHHVTHEIPSPIHYPFHQKLFLRPFFNLLLLTHYSKFGHMRFRKYFFKTMASASMEKYAMVLVESSIGKILKIWKTLVLHSKLWLPYGQLHGSLGATHHYHVLPDCCCGWWFFKKIIYLVSFWKATFLAVGTSSLNILPIAQGDVIASGRVRHSNEKKRLVGRAGFLKRAGPADFAGPPARAANRHDFPARADFVGRFSRGCGPGVPPGPILWAVFQGTVGRVLSLATLGPLETVTASSICCYDRIKPSFCYPRPPLDTCLIGWAEL